MTIVTAEVSDITGRPDNTRWEFLTPVRVREGSVEGSIITNRTRLVQPLDGSIRVELDPGPATIKYDGNEWEVTIPEEDSSLWDIISAAVAVPPDTALAMIGSAVSAWLQENPPSGDIEVDNITDAGTAGKDALLSETEADLRAAAGASATGDAVLTGDAAAGREALGATTVGDAVYIAANEAAARTALGSGTVGDDVFQQDTAAAVRNILAVPRSLTFAQFGAVGDGSADDTASVQDAVAAAKLESVPIVDDGGIYKLTDTIDARCTVAGASQSDDFKGIVGAGRQSTQFVQYTNDVPIFRFSGRYFAVKGFTAKYATLQTTAHTAGNVFDFEDWIYFSRFEDLLIENGYIGFNSKDGDRTDVGSGIFSNTFDGIRFLNNRHIPLRISATGGPSAGGTGNAWNNIYISNPSVDRIYRAIERFGGFEDVFNQLNIEQSMVQDCAIYDSAGDSLIINGLHCEGNKFACGSGERAIIATNGKGRVKVDIGIDECFFGAQKVSSITRSGTTATATVDLLGKTLGGHGLRVGDTVVVDGASQAEYNITATVTAVPSTTTFEYEVAGSPATPATLAASVDYIAVSLGSALGSAGIQVVKAISGAETIDIDGLRIRDVRVTGKSWVTRATSFRLAAAQDTNARVKIRTLSTRGQVGNAHLPAALDIVAFSRTSNVATAYTRLPHRLRVGDSVFVNTAATGYQLARQVTAVTGPHTFTYNSTGSDAALARATSSLLLMKTFGTTNRSRASNVATLTLDATHGLSVGMRVRIANISGYTATDAAISAVTATTISYVNAGADDALTADTGGVVMLLDAGISLRYLTEPGSAIVLEEADWLYSGCEALDVGTVNAGSFATQTTTHYGVRVGDRIDWTEMAAAIPDHLHVRAIATAADTITWRVTNPTAGNIVSGVNLINYRFTR